MSDPRLCNVELGDVAFESIERAGSANRNLPVYGVDRSEGLTPAPKYKSASVERYKVLKPGSFAYNPMRLNIGSIAYCGLQHPPGLVSPDYVVFGCNSEQLDPAFMSYLIKGPQWRGWTTAAGVGSVRVRIYFRELARMELRLPPLSEQKAIVAVLGALDDQIELNRRMNATLEAMARALFQSWFVDFDPVCAKAEGRPPAGLDEPTAALFPAQFQDSELGEIPQGWNFVSISDVVEAVYDGPHATPPEASAGPIFLGIKNLTGSDIDLTDIRYISESEWPRWTRRVTPKARDIVFSYEATLGFFALIPPGLRCCLGRRLALIRPLPENGHPHFWFHQFIAPDFQRYLIQHSIQGATVDRIPLVKFPNYPVLNPSEDTKEAFEMVAGPIWARIHSNADQSRTLATLRDTLLPKLLSGEVATGQLTPAS